MAKTLPDDELIAYFRELDKLLAQEEPSQTDATRLATQFDIERRVTTNQVWKIAVRKMRITRKIRVAESKMWLNAGGYKPEGI